MQVQRSENASRCPDTSARLEQRYRASRETGRHRLNIHRNSAYKHPPPRPLPSHPAAKGRARLTIPLISRLYRKIENNDSTIAELAAGTVITRCGSTSRIFMRKRSDAIYERVMHLTRRFRLRKKNKPETLAGPRSTVI